ncbi:energy transducer TonB [Sphingomonas arenae]|uniref:energy transducer TonB n=1 Tax=Sphingomonas arenae TaxID=2812555 RepID=UPI0019689C56|nr:energy transducer TonB [Sphingomonas arenae]
MLAYAAHRRPRRHLSPTMLSLIIGGHAVAIAFLVTAKMEVNPFVPKTPITIEPIPLPKDPPPPEPRPKTDPRTPAQQQPSVITPTPPLYPPLPDNPVVDSGPATTDIIPDIRPIIDAPLGPKVEPLPIKEPVKVAARLATPADLLRPPYPDSKLRTEEEAVLKLRLGIDERGRVVSVEPVGAADPEFLQAARKHLIRTWRYKPATEDGRPVATSITITLRFEMRDV